MASPNSKNTREFPRVHFSVEVTLESDHNFFAGITDNISEGGVFVAMPDPLARGAEVTFDLIIGEERHHIEGEVCWVRTKQMASADSPAGCGIRWKKISDEALKAIQRFIRGRDTLFYED